MQVEVTEEYIEKIKSAIEAGDDSFFQNDLQEMHAADIAEILHKVEYSDAQHIYYLLEEEKAGEVLLEINEELRDDLMATLSSKEIAEQLDNMDSDDAADLISELPENIQDEVLSHIEDIEQASDIADLLNYEEGTAGSLMAKELVSVYAHETIQECIEEIRSKTDNVEVLYAVYVVDDQEKLLGMLSLKKLILLIR